MTSLIETDIGSIAPEWEIVELGAVSENPQYGLTASAQSEGNAKFLRITDITDLGVNWNQVPYCMCDEKDLGKYLLRPGDIVFARIGATTGKSYLIKDPPQAVFASYLIRVRAKSEVDPEFLSHFFRSNGYWRQIDASKHNNLKKGVNGSVLKTLLLPKPTLDEQRRIARVLSTVQTAIEQQERLIALTNELKSALLHRLFTEGLRGEKQKQTEIGLVPESWDVAQIGNVAKLQSGGTPSRDKPAYWTGGTIPWVKTTEINYRVIDATEEFITEEGLNNSAAKIVPKGTLLVAMYGQGVTRGRVGILGLDAATNQACAAITIRDEKQVLTWFLYYYLQYHYQDLRELGHGANQRNLNMDLIKSFPLSYPKLQEQQHIVDSLSVLDSKLLLSEQKRSLLEELFRTLLHQLMTGKVRTAD